MHKVMVELDWDTIDGIVVSQLKSGLNSMMMDYENRKLGYCMAIFDVEESRDVAEIKKHIDAFKTLIEYYGGKDALKD